MQHRDVLSAIVLADGPHAGLRVAGLSLGERGRRVAGRAGAERVLVVTTAADRAAIPAWHQAGGRLLVIRAADQLTHTPLVADLVAAIAAPPAAATSSGAAPQAVAVAPAAPPKDPAIAARVAGDLAPGAYASALAARSAAADALAAALAAGDDDRELAAAWLGDAAAPAAAIPHGAIARYPVTDRASARAAERLLFRIIHKPQDNAITRYLFRPVSHAMTRVVVHTPITPNQVSLTVAVMCAIGLWLTARGPMSSAIAGTAVMLAASYVDCVDGEVARLKLLSSKFGAWLDTVVDELSSVGQVIAFGIHCHRWFGPRYFGELGFDPWLAATAIAVVAFLISIYCVYYNIIVVVGSANSQDYVGRFEIVDGKLRPAIQASRVDELWLPFRLAAIVGPNIIRRDFISWAALVLVILHLTHVAFGTLVLGGLVTAPIVTVDHIRLLRLRRRAARAA
ncbi:MAG: CDP-alcohol phosphatidyltransferase family protein [Kofleriaceae bacterium]|nr:CDP-alcohol phosphatidyltransferase family protein [Kofleriaceae bacterium]